MVVGLTMLAALQQLEQAAGQNIAVFNAFALGSGIDKEDLCNESLTSPACRPVRCRHLCMDGYDGCLYG